MSKDKNLVAILLAILAAALYAISTPVSMAPFIGALLSILMLGEPVTMIFIIASILMAAGCWIAAK